MVKPSIKKTSLAMIAAICLAQAAAAQQWSWTQIAKPTIIITYKNLKWGKPKNNGCTAWGVREFSSILHNVQPGDSWEHACEGYAPRVRIKGASQFSIATFENPKECKNTGLNMWGVWHISDPCCVPINERAALNTTDVSNPFGGVPDAFAHCAQGGQGGHSGFGMLFGGQGTYIWD